MEESLSIDQECIFHHEAVIRLYISKLRESLRWVIKGKGMG